MLTKPPLIESLHIMKETSNWHLEFATNIDVEAASDCWKKGKIDSTLGIQIQANIDWILP